MKSISKLNFRIPERKNIWFIISASIIFIGALFMIIFGCIGKGALNMGIDFTGGTLMEVEVGESVINKNYDSIKKDIEAVLKANNIKYSPAQKTAVGVSIRYENTSSNMDDANQKMENDIKDKIQGNASYGVTSVTVSRDTVSATASSKLIVDALLCVLIAAVIILIYVAIRFELYSGLSAIVGLAHDVLVMFAFVAIFRIQINSPFIAALITIIGYSINNTIVVFDRVREMKKRGMALNMSNTEITNKSIKNTIVRSINTTLTTLFTIVVLFIAGVSSIREFALPIMIGLIAGTYSSIFIAPSLWVMFMNAHDKRKKNKTTYQGAVATTGVGVDVEAGEQTNSQRVPKNKNYKNFKNK